MHLQPYLFFDGRCDEAIDFYRKALGAEVQMLMRFNQNPNPAANPPGAADKVMHAQVRVGDTVVLMSDGQCQGKGKFEGFALSVYAATEGEARKLFDALADGGKIQMPMNKTFFSPAFGMLTDRFGVAWMVLVRQ